MSNIITSYKDVTLKENNNIILHNITFEIKPGYLIYIVGAVGSGKSTLLKSIYGEKQISKGYAYVGNFDLTEIKRNELPFLRRTLGTVFQNYQLLNDRNVEKNISFALECTGERNKRLIRIKTQELSELAGIDHLLYKMPFELSGGEQQLVGITRALMNDPLLIIADEPTANLDKESSSRIMKLLKHLSAGGTAVIIATHDESLMHDFPGTVYNIKDKQLQVSI